MKKICVLALLMSSILLNANEKKITDIDEFAKEIEAIQEKTKNNALANGKEISKLQETLQLDELKARSKQQDIVKLNIDYLMTGVEGEIKKLENEILSTSFISSKSGYSIGKDNYKKVTLDDIEIAYNKIILLRKDLNAFKDNLETLKTLKGNDDKLLNNTSINGILQNLKNADSNMNNRQQQFFNQQQRKRYINVKLGDKVAGATIYEVSDFGIRIR